FFDELYNAVFVRNALRAGGLFWKADKNIVDGLGPDGVAARSLDTGRIMKKMQTGYIFHYAFVMMVGVVVIVSWFFYRFGV
ncbi:MAG: NADH-quinone oxidoreductase subunit L, partial [Micavibrio sp.]